MACLHAMRNKSREGSETRGAGSMILRRRPPVRAGVRSLGLCLFHRRQGAVRPCIATVLSTRARAPWFSFSLRDVVGKCGSESLVSKAYAHTPDSAISTRSRRPGNIGVWGDFVQWSARLGVC